MRAILIVTLLATLATEALSQQKIAVSRTFGNPGQVGLFIAAADGSDEHPLLASKGSDYDPVWAPDGSSIVFTSDRAGSADLFRVRPNGSGLEQLTNDRAYDDQAAFSPDSKQLVFVSTRGGGTSAPWSAPGFSARTDAAHSLRVDAPKLMIAGVMQLSGLLTHVTVGKPASAIAISSAG